MILGYDFVEERLFAARDYAGLSEEGAKYLRGIRSVIAKTLNAERNHLRKARDYSRERIMYESGGDFNKIFNKINKRTMKGIADNEILPNYANPDVYNEAINNALKDARKFNKTHASIAKRI